MKSHQFSQYSFNYPKYNIVLSNIAAFHEYASNGNCGAKVICNDGAEFLVGESVNEIRVMLSEQSND